VPKLALQTAQQNKEENILFIFDDVLLHHFKEKHIFDLASQPFAPVNLYNELMENTGVFENGKSFTSVFLIDTDSTSMHFLHDEKRLIQHLESISDQVVDFSSDRVSMTKGLMPVIDMKPDSTIIDYWQTPFVREVKHQLQVLINQLTASHQMHVLRKQFKMDEDPWDNYLIHDAKHFLPLLCHNSGLSIEEQAIVVAFIRQSIVDETISMYKPKGMALVQELIKFANEFKEDEDDDKEIPLLAKVKSICGEQLATDDHIANVQREIERVVKLFHLQMKVKGQLKPLKDDYFI